MADPYLQDDGQTLRNRLGIVSDPERLQRAEIEYVELRMAELRTGGLPDAQGFALLTAVHHQLFQDVYDWAGQARTTSLSKLNVEGEAARTTFAAPDRIKAEVDAVFSKIASQDGLRGLSAPDFAGRAAQHFSDLNGIHPFREGNGRTQRIVWEHIARQAGHDLSFEPISRERMISVSIAGSQGDLEPARRMFGELLDPERRDALLTATRFLEAEHHRGSPVDWNDRYVATTAPGQTYSGIYAGADGKNFMLGAGDRIYIGKLDDLPGQGAGVRLGEQLLFTAKGEAPEMVGDLWDRPATPMIERHQAFRASMAAERAKKLAATKPAGSPEPQQPDERAGQEDRPASRASRSSDPSP